MRLCARAKCQTLIALPELQPSHRHVSALPSTSPLSLLRVSYNIQSVAITDFLLHGGSFYPIATKTMMPAKQRCDDLANLHHLRVGLSPIDVCFVHGFIVTPVHLACTDDAPWHTLTATVLYLGAPWRVAHACLYCSSVIAIFLFPSSLCLAPFL